MRFALCACAALVLVSAAGAQEPAFPRRLLFVQIADYLVLNPLTHAAPGGPDRTRAAAVRLAADLRVPNTKDNDQVFVLSDALALDPHPPTRDVLAKALNDFCATTRAQDRAVIYFGAHAIEKDGKAFIVPIYGDTDAATAWPVAEVYAKLKELKAAQKVVIWDVCRTNPERVRGRREPGPMTPALFKALTAAPEGVQVLVSCSPGQHALENLIPRGPAGAVPPGSIYLSALTQAATIDGAENPKAAPGDAIPVDALHRAAQKQLALLVKGQTPALAGKPVPQPAEFDPKQAPPKRFGFPALPKGLPSAEVKALFDELALPPIIEGDGALVRYPFAEDALKEYAADVSLDDIFRNADKYPLRIATLRALQTVRNTWRFNTREQFAVVTIPVPVNDRTKRAVTVAQEAVAHALIELDLELERLAAVAGKRDKETKRWQAHYDYALAELRLRAVLLNESNRALGNVKTEALPDLPRGGTGWRLAPGTKVEGRKDVQALYKAADDGFASVIATYPGTPWELLAKRSRATLPGARWEPSPLPKAEEPKKK
jgi:hypothetical protein